MDVDAVGEVDGLQECGCGEGEGGHVVWKKAILYQQSEGKGKEAGRSVTVTLTLVPWSDPPREETRPEVVESEKVVASESESKSKSESEKEAEAEGPGKVVLTPGYGSNGGLLCGAGRGGMGYAGSDEYWEALRRRNGNLGAVWRGWWRGATAVRESRS